MTKVVRFNVVNTEPVELEVNDASEIDALNNRQVMALHNALDKFLNIAPFDDQNFFDRAIGQGVVYFHVSPSGGECSAMYHAECA